MQTGHNIGTVIGVVEYANDVVVVRKGEAPKVGEHLREEVKVFSRKSRQRLAFVASNTSVTFRTMVTLTYPGEYSNDGREVKRHLREWLREYEKDQGKTSYLWWLEFQQRGAPHFHILLKRPLPG